MLAILLIVLIVFGILAYLVIYQKDRFDYKGLCLFDIDGTLSTGTDNERVVQHCLDKGYAVGISTAGGIYQLIGLDTWPWMPRNLYNFMASRNFDTFNNVANAVLSGSQNISAYQKSLAQKPEHTFWPGWLKGMTLYETGKRYGITEPKKLIMFDNDPSYLNGLRAHNSEYTLVCAGKPCGDTLNLSHVIQYVI